MPTCVLVLQPLSGNGLRIPQAQLAVTTYLVDKLALRAGGEKDEDLADTVGVCTLRVSFLRLATSSLGRCADACVCV